MSVINKLGSGVGYIYATLPSAITIVASEKNTPMGVRNMRALGAVSAPIAASKSAVGTITITNAGAGNISAITINGVNQIAATVTTTVGDPGATALSIVNAINSYSPSGYVFTADAIGSTVYIYSTPEDGAAVNTLPVTVSVTNPATTTTTTDFSGGSSQGGIYDTTVGLRFFLDPTATAQINVLNLGTAEDISAYMVVRGLQTGVYTDTMAVNAQFQLTNMVRCSAITNIKIDTFGGSAASDLEYIDPSDFVQGDVIRFVQESSSRVVTLIDASNATTSPIANIYLTNSDPFICQGNRSIELRLQFDNVLGPIFVENSRSFTPAPNILSRADMQILIAANQLQVGVNYLITDAAFGGNPTIAGIQVQGITNNTISSAGEALFYLPDYQNKSGNFGGVYNALMPSVTLGKKYAFQGLMYINNTGSFTATTPPSDPINWTLVAITNPDYQKETHSVQYDIVVDQITKREDARGNIVTGVAACANFQWGNGVVANNIVQNGLVSSNIAVTAFQNNFCVNTTVPATGMYQGVIIANTMYNVNFSFSNSRNPSIQNNSFLNGLFSITNSVPNITTLQISNNTITNGWIVINGGTAPGPTQFINNNYTGTSFANQWQINNQTGSSVMLMQVTGNFITTQSNIVLNATLPGGNNSFIFKQNTILGIWTGTLTFNAEGWTVVGNTISNPSNSTSISATFTLQGNMLNESINNINSSYQYKINLATDLVGGILTAPLAALNAGVWELIGTGTISKILMPAGTLYFPRQPIKLTPTVGSSFTIAPTLKTSAAKGSIVSDGGNVTCVSASLVGWPISDFYVIQAAQTEVAFNGVRADEVWIKQYNTNIQ